MDHRAKENVEDEDHHHHSTAGSGSSKAVQPPIVRLPYAAVSVLAAGWVMVYADRLSISPLMNVIRGEFGLSDFEVSIVVSIYFLAYVGFTVPATIAASKYGYKKVMVLFFLLAAASLGFAGVLGYSYFLLVLFMGLHGVGAGAYYPTAYKISTEIVPKSRIGFSSALINSGMAAGSILGLIVAGFVLPLISSWQVVLVVLSIPTAAVALMFIKTVPRSNPIQAGTTLGQYRRVLLNPDYIKIAAAMFCSLYGYWVILTWGPGFLQESRGLGVLSSGATTAIFACVAIIPSIVISNHSDRIGRKRISLLLLPIAAATIFFMGYSTSFLGFVVAIAAYGIVGKLTLDPIAIAWVSDITPKEIIGPALALLNVTAMSSSIFAPLITGLFADATGSLSYGFYFGAAVVLAGTFFILFAGTSPRQRT